MSLRRPDTWKIALLLFGSGACTLVYETVWLRELRLVFGASTLASAAVIACFLGGLGTGGILLGKFALHLLEESRKSVAFGAASLSPGHACVDALAADEPNVPWERYSLALRASCYKRARHPLATRAEAEREEWERWAQ